MSTPSGSSSSSSRTPVENNIFGTAVPITYVYIVITLALFYISTRLLKAKSAHIFALILAYFIISRIQEKQSSSTGTYFEEIDYKLELLGAPDHLHHDANFINLFYEIYAWRQWNAYNYDNAIKAVNNVLTIEQDISVGLQRPVDNYELATTQSKLALNLIHGFIYNIDNPLLVTKLKNILMRLQTLLERHLAKMRDMCGEQEEKKSSIDVNSRFIDDAHGPKAFDAFAQSMFDFY